MENTTNNRSKLNQKINYIKQKLIDYFFHLFFVSLCLIIGISAYISVKSEIYTSLFIQSALFFVFTVTYLFKSKLNLRIKSIILLAIIFSLSQNELITNGIFSYGLIYLLLFVLLTVLLCKKKQAIFVFAISIFVYLLEYAIYINNNLPLLESKIENTYNYWIMGIAIYGIIMLIISLLWFKLTDILKEYISANTKHEENLKEINHKLTLEIESRKETESILVEQIADYEKLNKEINDANSDLGKTNRLLNEAKIKAEEANNLKSSFLSNISHEIRTPLNAILGFSAMLNHDSLAKDDVQKYTNIIQSSSNTLMNLISDIVNMSKIETNQFTIFPEPVNLDFMIDEISNFYTREVLIQKELDVSFSIEKSINNKTHIITDKECFNQITNKLIDNAIKFTEKGSIVVKFSINDDNFLVIEVHDTGIGIAKEKAQIIFDNFNQIDAKNSRKYGGLGIGLSIIKGLTKILNGKIEFNSVPNEGSKFIIQLPIILQESPETKSNEILNHLKGKTILIVGEQIRNNKVVYQTLQKSNCFILYVETGFQAIEASQQHPEISLVIIDDKLPDMQSNQVARMVLKYISSPILIHSPEKEFTNQEETKHWNGLINPNISDEELITILNTR